MSSKQNKVKIAPVTLGRFKQSYNRLSDTLKQMGTPQENITDSILKRQQEDALMMGISLVEFQKQLDSIKSKPKSDGKATELKEQFRVEHNRLVDNLLYRINNTTDNELANSLSALLDYDSQYQAITKIHQSTRSDWRGLIIVAPYLNDTSKLARYIGGWSDGSKTERNQYSSGRRVPVAKSTGFAKEQVLPEFTSK